MEGFEIDCQHMRINSILYDDRYSHPDASQEYGLLLVFIPYVTVPTCMQ